ncbi:MAG: FIG007959: peptidase, M16 family, partial [uncultured Solirubrobacteraceae bacterium]
ERRAPHHGPGLRRPGRHGGPALRAIRGARVLDRHGLRGGDGHAGRPVAPDRAHALPGHGRLRVRGDRPDLRRDGRRAQRGHGEGDDLRLLPRARRPPRPGVRRHGRHGLAPAVRRGGPRAGARDRPRGDRDVRGRPAGQGLRRPRGGGVRLPSPRAGDPRPRRRRRGHARAGARGLPRRALRAPAGRGGRRGLRRPRPSRRPRPGHGARHAGRGRRAGPRGGDGLRAPRALRHEGDRAVPRLPRRAGARAGRRAPLRPARPGHDPRRHVVLPALPGGPREARPGLLGLLLPGLLRRDGPDRDVPRDPAGQRRARRARGRRRARALPRGSRDPGRAVPGEGEPQGPRGALPGVHHGADEPPRVVRPRRAAAAHGRRAHRAHRRRLPRRSAAARAGAAGPRGALGGRDRRGSGPLPGRAGAGRPRAGRGARGL